jgi:hypothetical protein
LDTSDGDEVGTEADQGTSPRSTNVHHQAWGLPCLALKESINLLKLLRGAPIDSRSDMYALWS